MTLQQILFGDFIPPAIKSTRSHRILGKLHVEEKVPQPRTPKPSPVRNRMVKILRKNPGLTSKELADKAKMSVQGARNILVKLMASDEAYRVDARYYLKVQ